MRDQILNAIYKIYNKDTNSEIIIENRKLNYECSKKENIWHVYINDFRLKKKSNLIISYKCITCNTNNSIATTQFIRKINKCSLECPSCNIIKSNSINYDRSIKDIQIDSIEEFKTYPDDFKNSYLLNHLTEEDYNRIKSKIVGFCNKNKSDIDNYEFWSIYKTNNHLKFSSVIYDKINNAIFKADQPILICDNCNKEWRAKNIEQFKNTYKIICSDCKLCNRTFKIKSVNNLLNEKIIYQSKLELKFINWCQNNGIILYNGPSLSIVSCFGQNSESGRTYRVDFRIGNILIEIKDFHIWHKNQVESGLWDIKMNAINEYINENKLSKYYFLTPMNWNQKIKELKNDISFESYINNIL